MKIDCYTPNEELVKKPVWRKVMTPPKFFLFFFLLFSSFLGRAQTNTVTGVVADSTGRPLQGVTVITSNSNRNAVTNENGSFSIRTTAADRSLIFTYVGMRPFTQAISGSGSFNITLSPDITGLNDVVVVGYGSRRREALTGAISTVTSKDLDRVHGGSTVSSGLAGKLPGVSFRMPDGRPGASANIQIRNMGNPLYVIDGIQQDAGQFNNIAPNDVESITVLKDASAAIYGVRAANGVVVVTTKRGRTGTPAVNVDAFYGAQNWTRFPKVTTSSYEYMQYKADAEMNGLSQNTGITPAELERYKTGTEQGYQSFDWRGFILKPNAPMTSVNVNVTGGTENLKYYVSGTNLHQNSPLGREFKFDRTNFQSNIDARVSKRLRVGVQVNGRQETRTNPGVPGGDDYWLPRFAVLRNLPFERPYANDNPEYLNTIGQNDANWGFINYKYAGKYVNEWRVLQTNAEVEYQIPGIKGLSLKGVGSYFIADLLYNNQEYTYKTYTYRPATQAYDQTGGSINPWREKEQIKQINITTQAQLAYNNTFGEHTVGAVFVNERITQQRRRNWVRSIPASNALPLIYFPTLADYQDSEDREARIGYIGRLNYGYSNKYFLELAARRDASHIFAPDKRVGYFPSASVGWRITKERFMDNFLGGLVNELKLRGSYGSLGDDAVGLSSFSYLEGYQYGSNGVSVIAGQPLVVSRDRGLPIRNVTWFKSTITDVGADFSLLKGKVTGSFDWFYRKRTGLRALKYDILLPSEIGYTLPTENVESDAQFGQEGSLAYNGKSGGLEFNIGVNASYSRSKFLQSYKPIFFNSLDKYRNSREERFTRIDWGYEVDGQFSSVEEINNYPVNIDGQGNRTLLPGDLKYKDTNGDGKISDLDQRPIGYGGPQPNLNLGLTFGFMYKGFDFNADFSGGAGYTWFQDFETRWAFQNGGNLNNIFTDRWHRTDMYNLNSSWVPGKYPANRFNQGGHSNYNKSSTYWAHNVKYLRARTIQFGYTVPTSVLSKVAIKRARIYVNAYNLFSIDNLKQYNIDPEITEGNGLQFPQMKNVNVGVNLTF
ncbi:TonB-dependent receptor [Segetibacter sp.]|uniref:SusC/RagA family TonB-linked outer membrane protein n=1 Tax=Segetibacter sp. TaxID=2231182 RepID=UPI00262AB7CB|nr:TonB-dependent receptor [Segetibacter sp.]MCW3078586.1 TonB-dependent receptor [Segetibacter sp.]